MLKAPLADGPESVFDALESFRAGGGCGGASDAVAASEMDAALSRAAARASVPMPPPWLADEAPVLEPGLYLFVRPGAGYLATTRVLPPRLHGLVAIASVAAAVGGVHAPSASLTSDTSSSEEAVYATGSSHCALRVGSRDDMQSWGLVPPEVAVDLELAEGGSALHVTIAAGTARTAVVTITTSSDFEGGAPPLDLGLGGWRTAASLRPSAPVLWQPPPAPT